jgi:hypothetical protein
LPATLSDISHVGFWQSSIFRDPLFNNTGFAQETMKKIVLIVSFTDLKNRK